MSYCKYTFQLQDAQSKVKRMGDLMKEVRTWMDEAEKLIKYIRLQNDPEKENKIQEKIEVRLKNVLWTLLYVPSEVM